VRTLVLRLPSVLGLSIDANVRPKLEFLSAALGLSKDELREALCREPAVLGASLDKSLRPNLELWRAELPGNVELREIVKQRGLRWLTCNAEKRTRPRLRRATAGGLPAAALLTKMRLTDMAFDQWIASACARTADGEAS
jgi:mTERF domain-containing protein